MRGRKAPGGFDSRPPPLPGLCPDRHHGSQLRPDVRGIDLAVSDDALDLLAERGYDPVYGARPLKRVLQKDLAEPIATAILQGRNSDGDSVKVMVDERELTVG